MADYALSDVEVVAVALCKGPANRKRIFLKKSETPVEDLIEVTPQTPLIKVGGDDWRVVYTVVAEPEWEEQPGTGEGAVPGTTDVWANEQEILKAAHSFMRNGGLINFQHQGENACGKVVENFVAHGDMVVDGPEGPTTIKKGSWVVGIEPDDLMRALIENGTIEGVSYEGVGTRTLLAKASDPAAKGAAYRTCPKCGAKMGLKVSTCPSCGATYVKKAAKVPLTNKPDKTNWIEETGGLPSYIRRVAEHLHGAGKSTGEAIQQAIGIVRNWAAGHDGHGNAVSAATRAKAAAALAQYEKQRAQAKSDNLKKSVPSGDNMTLLHKIAKAVGLSDDDLEDLTPEEKALLAETDTLDPERKTQEENDVALTDEQTQALEAVPAIQTQVTDLVKEDGRLSALEANVATILERLPSKDEEQTEEQKREALSKSVETLESELVSTQEKLAKAQADLDQLAEGDTTQGRTDLKKSDNPDADLATALLG